MINQDLERENLSGFIFALIIGTGLTGIFTASQILILGELRDKLLIVSCVCTALLSVYSRIPMRLLGSNAGRYIGIAVASILVVFGMVPLERHSSYFPTLDITKILWCGFGLSVSLTFLFISMPFGAEFLYGKEKYSRMRKGAFFLLLSLAGVSFFQDARTVIDSSHSEYVINEILSYSAGHIPYFDFVPQYQTFYGLALTPFRSFFSGYGLLQFSFLLLYALSMLTILLLVRLARMCFRDEPWTKAALIILPFILVTPFGMRKDFTGSISTLLSAYPVRLFPGVVLISIYISLVRNIRETALINQIKYQGLMGLSMGVVIFQQQDFGIAAAIAILTSIVIKKSENYYNKHLVLRNIVLSSIITFTILVVLMWVSGHPVNWDYFAFFNRQFSGGFGAELIELPGPGFLVIPLICALFAFHFKSARDNSLNQFDSNLTSIGLVSILWVLIAFPYYINRSFASGQMQIFLGLIGLSLAAFLGKYHSEISREKSSRNYMKLSIESLYLRGLLALPLALVILIPNPVVDGYRIYKGSQESRFANGTISKDISAIRSIQSELANEGNDQTLGYFGNLSNFVELETGAKSLSLFNNPRDLTISESSRLLGCKYLQDNLMDYVYFDDSALYYLDAIGSKNCLPSIELNQEQNFYELVDRNP